MANGHKKTRPAFAYEASQPSRDSLDSLRDSACRRHPLPWWHGAPTQPL
ncbi:hypothetical protein D8I24_2359 [Cupriavidus necator H850]|nr:hypothetical protein D8I24_2359 [Cupriavidus necator H850]